MKKQDIHRIMDENLRKRMFKMGYEEAVHDIKEIITKRLNNMICSNIIEDELVELMLKIDKLNLENYEKI